MLQCQNSAQSINILRLFYVYMTPCSLYVYCNKPENGGHSQVSQPTVITVLVSKQLIDHYDQKCCTSIYPPHVVVRLSGLIEMSHYENT